MILKLMYLIENEDKHIPPTPVIMVYEVPDKVLLDITFQLAEYEVKLS